MMETHQDVPASAIQNVRAYIQTIVRNKKTCARIESEWLRECPTASQYESIIGDEHRVGKYKNRFSLPANVHSVPVNEAVAYMMHAKKCTKRGECSLGEECFKWKFAVNHFNQCNGSCHKTMFCTIKSHLNLCRCQQKCSVCSLAVCLGSLGKNGNKELEIVRHIYHTELKGDEAKLRLMVALFSDIEYTSEDLVKAKPKRTHTQAFQGDKVVMCPVCWMENPAYTGMIDGCEHKFCYDCIYRWAESSAKTCPVCRNGFVEVLKVDENNNILKTDLY